MNSSVGFVINKQSIFEQLGLSLFLGFGKKETPAGAGETPAAPLPPTPPVFPSPMGGGTDKIDCSGKKVLIVDDNLLNIKITSKSIGKYNFTVESSTSGKDCIDKIKAGNAYDLILMDYMMPVMDGIETLKGLKGLGINLPPVIVLTANVIVGMREKYLAAGFDEYLAKPLNPKELDRVIGIFFEK